MIKGGVYYLIGALLLALVAGKRFESSFQFPRKEGFKILTKMIVKENSYLEYIYNFRFK